jgi:hypothetical protein
MAALCFSGAPAMAAAIWNNHRTGQPVTRSLIAHDH